MKPLTPPHRTRGPGKGHLPFRWLPALGLVTSLLAGAGGASSTLASPPTATDAAPRAETRQPPSTSVPGGQVQVGPGVLRPFYPPSPKMTRIPVAAFMLDRVPVTNAEFLAFVAQHPRWQRDKVSSLFADSGYLRHWAGPLSLGTQALPDQPVTRVSWFAAKAFCEAQGKRLPTEYEWELAAAATRTKPDSRNDLAWRKALLDWYSKPNPSALPLVGTGQPNFWGVYNLHGLVWEWVMDFNSAMVTGDNREDGSKNKVKFCGAGALAATDADDYASFMRLAFRSSLEAHYSTQNLGFRCAADLPDRKSGGHR